MEQGKIMEAEVPTVRVGTTPTELTVPQPPQTPKVFYRPDGRCPSCRPTNSVKALKAIKQYFILKQKDTKGKLRRDHGISIS